MSFLRDKLLFLKHIREGGVGGEEKRKNICSIYLRVIVADTSFLLVSCPVIKSCSSVLWRGYPFTWDDNHLLCRITI